MQDEDTELHVSLASKAESLQSLLHKVLSCDLTIAPNAKESSEETSALNAIGKILNEYQEQSYLLDPYWEALVSPTVDVLRNYVQRYSTQNHSEVYSTERLGRLSVLIYEYIKCRGYKTIVRFFPHQVSDLLPTLSFFEDPHSPARTQSEWALRYIALLWLSLICMIPFDLSRFDTVTGTAASRLEALGLEYLSKSGLEREAAALLLARVFLRKDCSHRSGPFLSDFANSLSEEGDVFQVLGSLRVILHVVAGSGSSFQALYATTLENVVERLGESETLMANSLIRKYRLKLATRNAIALLPTIRKAHVRGRLIHGEEVNETGLNIADLNPDEDDVPPEVETSIDTVLPCLEDKDTTVRWSAAKGLARISERLPGELADQVMEAILRVFTIYSSVGEYDLPTVAESSWHGACLAAAEMTRRGLTRDAHIAPLVQWMSKAIYFDIRKGAHSIGSTVRDAACYVIWSLVRSTPIDLLRPFAAGLSKDLVTVSLFDREVHIRRAASAAFQEAVGRTSIFPRGIDVLRMTDFYAISIRRNAFLVAAPQVARYIEYRPFMIAHLLKTTVRHWDVDVRSLGAQALREISSQDLPNLCPVVFTDAEKLLHSKDNQEIHGGLVTLMEITETIKSLGSEAPKSLQDCRFQIFRALRQVPTSLIQTHRNELIVEVSCRVIANTLSPRALADSTDQVPFWRNILDVGLRHVSAACQEAAADALHSLISMVNAAGVLRYDLRPELATVALNYLQSKITPEDRLFSRLVETRKACFKSITRILKGLSQQLYAVEPTLFQHLYSGFLVGLEDYTVDQRGDVGSWIRMTCVTGLTTATKIVLSYFTESSVLSSYLPPSLLDDAIARILKQGVERLDNVRQMAGEELRSLFGYFESLPSHHPWNIHGRDKLRILLQPNEEGFDWRNGTCLFPLAVHLLDIPQYRNSLLRGFVLSIGSKTSSTHRPASQAFVQYAESLPLESTAEGPISFSTLLTDLFRVFTEVGTRHNTDIAVLQSLELLLDCDSMTTLADTKNGASMLQSNFALTLKHADKLKNVQRVQAMMKCAVGLFALAPLAPFSCRLLPIFLSHRFPKIRSETAEQLYTTFLTREFKFDTADAEEIILSTDWSNDEISLVMCQRFLELVTSQLET